MGTIKQIAEGVAKLNVRAEVPKIMEATGEEIIRLNQAQLFVKGENFEGVKLKEYRNFTYAQKKNQQNPQPGFGNPDLYATGAFYRSFQLTVDQGHFEVSATDSKTESLEEKYGETLFGLNKESQGIYAKGVFFDKLKDYIETTSGLKMQ